MKFLKLAMLVGGFMLLSSVAWGQEAWRKGSTTTDDRVQGNALSDLCDRDIGPGTTCFWAFNGSDSAADSPVLNITAEYATLTFDADLAAGADGVGNDITVRMIVDHCSGVIATTNNSNPINNGDVILMTGEMSATLNSAFIFEIPRGCLYIDVTGTSDLESMVKVTGAPLRNQ